MQVGYTWTIIALRVVKYSCVGEESFLGHLGNKSALLTQLWKLS